MYLRVRCNQVLDSIIVFSFILIYIQYDAILSVYIFIRLPNKNRKNEIF